MLKLLIPHKNQTFKGKTESKGYSIVHSCRVGLGGIAEGQNKMTLRNCREFSFKLEREKEG